MSDRLEAIIEARDNASAKFRQVSDSAKQLDTQLDNTGKSADRFNKGAAAMGAAVGSLLGLMGDAARANAEAEVSQQRLEASIEATGAIYEQYADQIKAAGDAAVQMGFDDEDAADSISAITQATGDATTAINDMALVMDIARGRGIDLAAASKIVIAAEQGRFTALRRIGIVLDENATKEEAIAALQQKYAGQAEAYAETNIGAMDRLSQMYENGMEAVGGYAGEAQMLLMLLPGLSAGFTAVSAAVAGLSASMASGGLAKLMGGGAGMLGGAGVAIGGIAGGLGLVGWMLAHPEATGLDAEVPFFELFQQDAEKFQATVAMLQSSGNQYAADTGKMTGQIVTDLTGMAVQHRQLWAKIEDDVPDTPEQLQSYYDQIGQIDDKLGKQFANNSAFYLDQIATGADRILGYTGEGADLARVALDELNAQFESGWLSPMEYATQVAVLSENLTEFDERAANGERAAVDLSTSMAAAGDALTYQLGEKGKLAAELLADAVVELNTVFGQNQQALTQERDALDDVFRGIVGNTNGIAQMSQGVADWSAGLMVATEHTDEFGNSLGWWSEADTLLQNAVITQGEYNAAVQANTDIQAANASIQEDVLSIQTQLAPVIAASTEALAQQMDAIAEGDTDAQLFALGMMDAATASQALGLAQGYLADADTFGPMIQQAAELNPMLAQILEEMGLISYNPATGEVKLLGADETKTDLETINASLERLAYTQILIAVDFDKEDAEREFEEIFGKDLQTGEPLVVDVPIDPNYLVDPNTEPPDPNAMFDFATLAPKEVTIPITPAFEFIQAGGLNPFGDSPSPFSGGDLGSITVPVTADTAAAAAQLDELATYTSAQSPEMPIGANTSTGSSQVDELASYTEGQTPDIIVGANTGTAMTSIDQAVGHADSSTGTIAIDGDASGYYAAIPVLGVLLGTNYIDIVTRQTTITQSVGAYLGGVPHFAAGGVAEMGEYGDEIVRFADGGIGRTRGRGLYGVPNGAYVTPAPASLDMLGGRGVTVVVNVAGSVISERELAAVVAEAIGPALLDVMDDAEMRAER